MELNLLKTSTVTIRDVEFGIREMPAVKMLELLDKLQSESRAEQTSAQIEMIECSVTVNGESMLGQSMELPMDVHMALVSAILTINKVDGSVGNGESSPQEDSPSST